MSLVALAICLLAEPLLAQTPPVDGDTWLSRLDGAMSRLDDARVTLAVQVTDRHGARADRELVILQRNAQRLVRITAPPRLAGVAVLMKEGVIHLYLPAFRKARRVSGKGRGDAFLGTDFTLDDLTRRSFGDEYRATVLAVGKTVQLRLTPKDPGQHDHAAIELRMRAVDYAIVSMAVLDTHGTALRRVGFSDYRPVGGRPFAHRFEVEDVRRKRRTVARVTHVNDHAGLSDRIFSVSRLHTR